MKNIEIERKIILKGVPDIEYDQVLNITQYYFKNEEGIWERFRRSEDQNGEVTYIKTIKTTISKGISNEDEDIISKDDYKNAKSLCKSGEYESRRISKIRHVKYVDGTDLKWEIDEFTDINITIAEIEIPTLDFEVDFPDYITDVMIKEVTGIKEFNNRRMAEVLFTKETV
ncbi:MAG: putative phosphatase [uncultured marine phage]|uniref:Putative phosphatase n=1 Tax=uncultured marine phage TaxID=707152 RepID=A0A8D9CBV1_9VIRU|nr:MAG: putative phosphatase [uncultured marine phage]